MGIGGKVCVGLSFFPFLFSPYLWYSVDDNVGVHSVSGPNSFSLVPPPALGSPPVCYKVPFVVRVKRAILWAVQLL